MIGTQEVDCRKICAERFFLAIACSTGSQFLMLLVFLLFVNFSLLHPVAWIVGSIGRIFSLYTWLSIIPLIGSVGIYGVLMARHLLTQPKYHRNRFSMYRSSGRKVVFLGVHGVVGFLTAWLYAKFLPQEYSAGVVECDGQVCLNDKYIFLILSGVYMGIHFFRREFIKSENLIVFPVIQQGKYLQMTSSVRGIFCKSLSLTLLCTVTYTLGCWPVVGGLLKWTLEMFALRFTHESIFGSLLAFLLDWRLLIFQWILSSQIVTNMNLINRLFIVFLTEYRSFPIVQFIGGAGEQELTMAEALAAHQVPVIQDLACQDLFMVANGCDAVRRRDIFTLSIPGGHPHNWKCLVTQSLSLLTDFTQKLTKSIEGMQIQPTVATKPAFVKPTATSEAERLLWAQHSEGQRIHRVTDHQEIPQPPPPTQNFYTLQDFRDALKSCLEASRKYFMNYPGIHYLFSETPHEEIFFHLSHSQRIVWIVQALAALAEKSVDEDRFGVVQNDLKDVITALLQLKNTLEKIGNLMLGERRIDRNFLTLKSAVKRSLYRICNTFSPYFGDLRLSEADLRHLSHFVTYKEA